MKGESLRMLSTALLLCAVLCVQAAPLIKGVVLDKKTGEPLIGVNVLLKESGKGVSTDMEGAFEFGGIARGSYTLAVSYITYRTRELTVNTAEEGSRSLVIELEPEEQLLNEVTVTARKRLEGERALLMERQTAILAIENMGTKEMAVKGISNVQEGVKKLTGISIASAGQLIVRGLGDRYSSTTLNGLAIASPNPDNKLIPLDLFPTSTVQNITVSKVYGAEEFADYSGAHIDIRTKEDISDDFLSVGLSTGGALNTLGKQGYRMDRAGSLFSTPSVDGAVMKMSLTEFDQYVKTKEIFPTSFAVEKRRALPDLGGELSFGKRFTLGGQSLHLLGAVNASNGYRHMTDAFARTLEATGNVQSDFAYDSYEQTLNVAALGYAGCTLRSHDRIGYTFFYTRNASDTYQLREGTDSEGHDLTGSHNTTHIYTLTNHQLTGRHHWNGDRLTLEWDGSYGETGSSEPDRRQVMFVRDEGTLRLFKLNRQETMRYFGSLDETEWNGKVAVKWQWRDDNFLKVGFNYKDKDRDYTGTRFYYNLNRLNPTVTSVYDTDDYLNQVAVADGTVTIERKMQPKDSYRAGNEIAAGYAVADFYPVSELLVNLGLRYEQSCQWVRYASDGGERYGRKRTLEQGDLFPTLNLKYTPAKGHTLRFSASRTVTRPSFVEMAPFLYQETYGGAQIRGNENLTNAYNYNFDLRYELFAESGDMLSVTGYFKHLNKPIERIQELNGGATLHSFRNAEDGMAGGVEMEFRKTLAEGLRLAANVSYMYTNVKLPQDGAYTNKERSLQGASPILVNADLTYAPRLRGERTLNMALLYNLQGSRIHAVGVSGLGDIVQEAVHTLNFNLAYSPSAHWNLKLKVNDLLGRDMVFKQEVPATGSKLTVERYGKGTDFEVGIGYKL